MRNPERCKKRNGLSIRWKLIVYFAIFVAIALLVMWVFQVYLLNNFYELVKRREMARSAQTLSMHLEREDLDIHAYDQALDGVMGVEIYRVTENEITQLVSVDATGQAGNTLAAEQILRLCQKAAENEGSFTGRFTFGGLEVNNKRSPFPNNKPQASMSNVRLIHLELVERGEGSAYLIVLNAALQPLSSTVQILQTQFLWISTILLICAGVMVFYLYRHISSPLVKMNESAKQLAYGKYDVEFSGEGYRETRELADTLNYASHELSRLDRLQKELIANISHDLRTPLTMIKGYSEVMRDIPGENTSENVQVIIDETKRLSSLVNNLLEVSKAQKDARVLNCQVFCITELLRETVARFEKLNECKGYTFMLDAKEDAFVFADKEKISQVLYNLIGNAVNYTGEDKQVFVSQTNAESVVRIDIYDTGDGIEAEKLPHIWQRYYRADAYHKRSELGMGIGLSIVKDILDAHNAAFGVSSKIGHGSDFWFKLHTVDEKSIKVQ